MPTTSYKEAKKKDAFRYPPEVLDSINVSIARSCRWEGGEPNETIWRDFLESLVLFGQQQPGVMADIPQIGERLIEGFNRLKGIKQINHELPEWQTWLDQKIQETTDKLALDTGISAAMAAELQTWLQIYKDARKRIEQPMAFEFVSKVVKSAEQADMMAFHENTKRFAMSPMDKANLCYTKSERGETNREIAVALGFPSATHVGYYLDFFKLSPDTQRLIHDGHITEALARKMKGLPSGRQTEICAEAKKGTKPSELLRNANADHRKDGERVSRSMTELRGELTAIRLDGASPEVARVIAAWLFEWLAGNPESPSLDVILAAEDELPTPPPVEVKPAKEARAPKVKKEKVPKAAKPKKEKPPKAVKQLSKKAAATKAAAERKEAARKAAEEEAASELEGQEPEDNQRVIDYADVDTDTHYEGEVPEVQAATRAHDAEQWNC